MAHADAHVEAAVADLVDVRGRLRQVERQAVVDRHDRGAELDRLRGVGHRKAQSHPIAEAGAVGALEARGFQFLGEFDSPFAPSGGGGEGNSRHLHEEYSERGCERRLYGRNCPSAQTMDRFADSVHERLPRTARR